MDKKKIINILNEINFDINEFYVLGSASLVLRDILTSANDIDLCLSKYEFDKLSKIYDIKYLGESHNTQWYQLNDIIEFCVDDFVDYKIEVAKPFNLIDLDYLLYYFYFEENYYLNYYLNYYCLGNYYLYYY